VLSGKCPKCDDEGLSNVIDFKTIVGDQVIESWGPRRADTVKVEVVCTCSTVHQADRTGCGWGKGLEIDLKRPVVV
jgi:hypothetical protein